jgi:CRP-like cAMP-binding protein
MATVENHLIQLLPRGPRRQLLALCESVPLTLEQVLCKVGEATRYAWFPKEGFISLLAHADNGPGLEVGMVGREGMLGAQLALGVATTPLLALVQGEGVAWRVPTAALKAELAQNTALQAVLGRYIYVLMAQLATASPCLRYHQIEPRLARWLLMSQDRAQRDNFAVTHEFLSHMLGVRRVGVTTAAGALQRAGLIAYKHGQLQVLDRAGLEAAACSCYGADRAVYRKLLR